MTQDMTLAFYNTEHERFARIEERINQIFALTRSLALVRRLEVEEESQIMAGDQRNLSDRELVEHLRRAASIWFKNDDLLLLEELIRRYRHKGVKVDADISEAPIE